MKTSWFTQQHFDRMIQEAVAVEGELIGVEVASRRRMGALDPTLEYFLNLKVKFVYQEQQYLSTSSPFTVYGTEEELAILLKDLIVTGAKITVYFQLQNLHDPNHSVILIDDLTSWNDVKRLKGFDSDAVCNSGSRHLRIYVGILMLSILCFCFVSFLLLS